MVDRSFAFINEKTTSINLSKILFHKFHILLVSGIYKRILCSELLTKDRRKSKNPGAKSRTPHTRSLHKDLRMFSLAKSQSKERTARRGFMVAQTAQSEREFKGNREFERRRSEKLLAQPPLVATMSTRLLYIESLAPLWFLPLFSLSFSFIQPFLQRLFARSCFVFFLLSEHNKLFFPIGFEQTATKRGCTWVNLLTLLFDYG